MNILNKAKILVLALVAATSFTSCKDWLNVSMEDKIMEKDLYQTYDGFLMALNGVYLGMNDLYSSTLSTGAIDVMAQYYNVTENNNHSMKLYSSYSYLESTFESANYNMWSRLYTLIANTNAVIEHTEDVDAPLSPKEYAIIRGEALALRAFFHFDLLRLYGPIFSVDSKAQSIAYQNSTNREIQPLLPADEMLEKIIADLHAAEALLKDFDPILTDGVLDVTTEDNGIYNYDMSFRQIRMNYYAVELMLARAYMWKGDKATAYDIAKHKIIDAITTEDLEVFPWTTKAQVDAEGRPDYLFSSEVIFSLYNSKRSEIQSSYFGSSLRAATSRLTFYGDNMVGDSKITFFYDDVNDLRRKIWRIVEPTDADRQQAAENNEEAKSSLAMDKYAELGSGSGHPTFENMIPLMRITEAYLIAAEATSDPGEARTLINTIREHRECLNLPDDADLDDALTYEMAREVIGEGQLFFFYKRRNAQELISGTSANGVYNMVSTNYVIPIPQSELDKRVLVNNK